MASDINGWCGKILKVDLSDSRITEMDTMEYADRFLGGRGIATRIYWDEVGPEVGAFDPENRLILMSGPLAATGAQGASRFEVVGKSPMSLPEGFNYGNLGGSFGPYMKKAGFDGIVIFGCAEKPSYLWINGGKVEILDAATLWGKGVYAVSNILKHTHGDHVRFVTTGISGENLCRTAALMTNNEGCATGGFGAVMGSKNLKAIAIVGEGTPNIANPDDLRELNRFTIHLNKRGPMFSPFPPEHITRVGKASCFQCGLDCTLRSTYRTADGKDSVRKCQSMFVYYPWVMRTPGESPVSALDATGVCNDLSLCTMEMANVIEWLSTCFQAGDLSEKETGIDISKLGTIGFFKDLAHMCPCQTLSELNS